MDRRLYDAVSVITVIVLLPAVGVSLWAVLSGEIGFDEYRTMWAESLALLLGFWLRGFSKEG